MRRGLGIGKKFIGGYECAGLAGSFYLYGVVGTPPRAGPSITHPKEERVALLGNFLVPFLGIKCEP